MLDGLRQFIADIVSPNADQERAFDVTGYRLAATALLVHVVSLDGEPTEIIGVASAALDSTGSPDFFLPLRMSRATPVQGAFGYNAIARLKPGVRAADASTHLIPIVRKFMDMYGASLRAGGTERANYMQNA